MRYHTRVLPCLLMCWLLLGYAGVWAQTALPGQAIAPSQDLESPIRPETVAARKAAIQARLEALSQANLPAADQDATRATMEQLLKALSTLETAFQQRATSLAHLDALPQRLRELEAERQTLEAQSERSLPPATEALRDRYEAQVQAVQTEIQELHQQMAASEVRLGTIARELEQRAQDRAQMEKDSLIGQSKSGGQDAELLAVKRQMLRAEVEALTAERDWLTKRRPLHDILLSIAQLRRTHLQQDLETVTQSLRTVLQQEKVALQQTAVHIEQTLEQTADPAKALPLALALENVEIRKTTGDYQQQRHRLGDVLLAQEKRNTREKQHLERLASLVEKYTSGEVVVQRLTAAFKRLRRERLRYQEEPVKALAARLRTLTGQMFTLDDRLYTLDEQAEARLAALPQAMQTLAAPQREADVALIQKTLDEQKSALREQQQELTALLQEVTRLLTLHREYKSLLDDGYHFVLSKMFWLQSAETFGWSVVRGMVTRVKHLYAFANAEQALLRATLPETAFLRGLTLLLLVLLWVAWRVHRRLRDVIATALAGAAQGETRAGLAVAGFLLLQSSIWPAVVVLVAWVRRLFVPAGAAHADLALALVSSLQLSALVLWIGLFGRALVRQHGWAQQFWSVPPDLCSSLRRVVTAGCAAALLFLVPRHVLLTAPGEALMAAESLALARGLFLAFQGVILALVAMVGRRKSLLMRTVLARSRDGHGLLWRLWPLVHMALIGAVLSIMIFDVLGYNYAARYLWSTGLISLLVLGLLQGIGRPLGLRALRRLVAYSLNLGERWQRRLPAAQTEVLQRTLAVIVPVWNTLLALLSGALLLEIWGISVRWLLTSSWAFQLLSHVVVIGLLIGLAIGVIQASNALTEYLLRLHATRWAGTRQFGRKFRTLAPLLQTLIWVLVVFVTTLVILEQLGIATGPLLAGVGIFGLAIGFASQSLIKDVINGLFLLFEDSLSVGDIVMLRGIGGQVEKVTLRAVTIRDLSGNVHVIPNSSIDMVTNMTKDFSRYVLDIPVAYREDVDAVTAVLRDIDDEMRADPVYGRDMLEPLEILGLDRFEDSAMVIVARLKTRPIQQWRIGREFKRRMKKAFDACGIEIPFPHRTLYWGVAKDGALREGSHSPLPQPGCDEMSIS